MQHVLLLVLLFALPIIVKARASLTVNIANIGALVLVLVETLVRLVVVVQPHRIKSTTTTITRSRTTSMSLRAITITSSPSASSGPTRLRIVRPEITIPRTSCTRLTLTRTSSTTVTLFCTTNTTCIRTTSFIISLNIFNENQGRLVLGMKHVNALYLVDIHHLLVLIRQQPEH